MKIKLKHILIAAIAIIAIGIHGRASATTFHEKIYGAFEPNNQTIVHLEKTLKQAKKGDTIIIKMHSPGGLVYIGTRVAAEITATKAKVMFELVGSNYSMAALLLCTAKPGTVTTSNPHFVVMYHDLTVSLPRQKLYQYENMIKLYRALAHDLFVDLCGGVLTEKEIQAIMHGHDTYISAADFIKRINHKK